MAQRGTHQGGPHGGVLQPRGAGAAREGVAQAIARRCQRPLVRIDLERLAERLRPAGDVKVSRFLLRFTDGGTG